MAKRRVSWRFIPPYSPHFGGLWESAVKIMKSHLKKTVLSQVLTIEEFNTVLCRIEMIMNSRPIAPMTNHPDDCSVITPNHFLIGEGVGPLDFSGEKCNLPLKQRLQLIQELTTKFWHNWQHEYLRAVQCKSRWLNGPNLPSKSDLVLVRRDFQPPGQWKRARIEDLIRGSDNEVRVVNVYDGNTLKQEAVRNLLPLELSTEAQLGEDVAATVGAEAD